ncbi:MAG: zinc ribbon domain-containing protein [Gemmatimonadaceae bacterium]
MNSDLEALLVLQQEDEVVGGLKSRVRTLEAREQSLVRERDAMAQSLERARAAVEAEEKRRRELEGKVQQHKQLQDHNLAQLDQVRKPKEATAAMLQIEMTRKVLAQEESDLQSMTTRLGELRHAVHEHEMNLELLGETQQAARDEIAAERALLEGELGEAQSKRDDTAQRVSKQVLSKYERIRGRDQGGALYPLRGMACGRCNTAIPLQRRNVIAAGRAIDVCEGCGVLLYAAG